MAAVLFTTFGSLGDLHPYIAIGQELRKLGHQAAIGTIAGYEDKITSQGLGFVPIRPHAPADDPALVEPFFDQFRGTERVLRALASVVRESYQDTLLVAREFDAMVTHPTSLGAVLVAQQLKLPWISSVLAPASFLSACDPPVLAPAPWLIKVRALGPGAMRAVWRIVKPVTRYWLREVIELRREIGLASRANPLFEGAHSPDLVLALFSRRFAQPQPDWPANTIVTGFPFFDDPDPRVAPELETFLETGPAPVIFTLGSSAVAAAGDFYAASLQAIERLGVRALFLTGSHPQNLPGRLPRQVLAWPYAPHEQVFPRASAIVHQGGIGTTAQALRSGRPMLVVPFAHDQFDNAGRARRLSVAATIPRRGYTPRTAERALARLLSSPNCSQAAISVANAVRAETGAAAAAVAIDNYLRQRGLPG